MRAGHGQRQKQVQEQAQKQKQRRQPTLEEEYEPEVQDVLEDEPEMEDEDHTDTSPPLTSKVNLETYEPKISRAGFIVKTARGYRLFRKHFKGRGSRKPHIEVILDKLEEFMRDFSGSLEDLKESLKNFSVSAGKGGMRSGLKDYYVELPDGKKIVLSDLTPSGRPRERDREGE